MAEIQHQLNMGAARPRILETLTNLAALERWHRARVSGGPQDWTVAYPDGPTFRWKVVAATNDQVTWRCEEGPGNAKGSERRPSHFLTLTRPEHWFDWCIEKGPEVTRTTRSATPYGECC